MIMNGGKIHTNTHEVTLGISPVDTKNFKLDFAFNFSKIDNYVDELAPGVDALLHVSQISKEHVEKPSDVLKVGQKVEAKVVDFNEEDKKISLSMKALLPEEEADTEEVPTEE